MRHEAIYNTHPNVKSIDDGLGAFDENGNSVTIDEAKVAEEIKRLQADYDSKQYQRDRADAYPDLKEQLDLLWHAIDGDKFNVKSKETDFYKKLKAVKDANPKPE